MKKIFIALLIGFSFTGAQSQNHPLTTFILVRHAEKANDGTKDPDLAVVGVARAERLAAMLKDANVSAIYSTNFRRTRNTVNPLAVAKGLEVALYDPLKGEEIDKMLDRHRGGTIVVVGHSNTVPWTSNYLTGGAEVKDFEDGDYSNLLVVTVAEKGKAKLTWLKY